jgi:hypothetical protein
MTGRRDWYPDQSPIFFLCLEIFAGFFERIHFNFIHKKIHRDLKSVLTERSKVHTWKILGNYLGLNI